MTIPSTTRKAGPFTGNGSNTSFPFTFKVFSTEDVAVTVNDALGAETVLVLDSDYSVTLNVDQEATPGGTVTYPISGSPLASGLKLSITGAVAYEQGTDIPTGGDFNPTVLENALDSLSMQIQQLDEAVSRAAVVPVTSPTDAAELSANIDLLATNITKLTTLYDNIDDIATVAADLNEPVSEINTVAGSVANVDAVGGSIANVNTVAGSIANVNAVAGNATNINAVAGNATNINAVAGNATNINAVNANSTNINTVASDLLEPVSEIETVAGSITNVNTVGNNIANVNTVAGISGNVITVAGVSANVTTVAGIAPDVTTVAGIATDVAAVENIAANVTTVANISSNVTTVAGISANVTTVAGISSAVTTVATNIADVQNAEENATAAINAKTAAESARDATLAALDSFDDRYLGQKASDPTLDNDGNALAVGALYFNTTTGVMKVYDGTAWLAAYASLSGALLTTNNLSDLTNAATARSNLGVAIGTDVQAYDPDIPTASASQAEVEAGTETQLRSVSPLRIAQAIQAIGLNSTYYDQSALFSGSQTSLVLPNINVIVNGTLVRITGSTLALDTAGNWDNSTYATAANRAGRDFYVYALQAGGVILSNNSTFPTGYTATNSRKIGGFHCLCVAVGTISGHQLTGYVAGDILPRSVWDRFNRSSARQEGTILSRAGVWVDIYLPSVSGSTLVSVNNATIADGTSSPAFHCYKFEQWFARQGMKSISQLEFFAASDGANQSTNITGSADPGTTTGHTDTAGRRMISNEGVEDICGVLWQWTRDQGGVTTAASWANAFDGNDSGVGGQHYQAPYRGILGGGWDNGALCGSRASLWYVSPLDLYSTLSGRGVAEPANNRF